MHIKFIGAVSGSITGSCTFLHHKQSDTQILIDCGLFQEHESDKKNSTNFPFTPSKIKYVLLTHAHIDHCGLIPKLYKDGFKGKVITTEATAKIATVMMKDCAKIANLYSDEYCDLVKFEHIKQSKLIPIADNLFISFLRNSHILGASSILVSWGIPKSEQQKSILFSGDVGCNSKENEYLPLLKANHFPQDYVDYIFIESTYGDTIRDDKYKNEENRLDCLTDIIGRVVFKESKKLIIPAFSLDRIQSIVFDIFNVLTNKLPNSKWGQYLGELKTSEDGGEYYDNRKKIVCYSALAKLINNIYSDELSKEKIKKNNDKSFKYFKKSAAKVLENNGQSISTLFSKRIATKGHIIQYSNGYDNIIETDEKDICIASAGMGDFGPINNIIKHNIDNSDATILLTGYAPPDSLCGKLRKLGDGKHIEIDDKIVDISAKVIDISKYYSAHADQTQLLEYLFHEEKTTQDTTIFINHGNDSSKSTFKKMIEKRAKKRRKNDRKIDKVYIADDKNWFDLETGKSLPEYKHPDFQKNEILEQTNSELLKQMAADIAFIKDILTK